MTKLLQADISDLTSSRELAAQIAVEHLSAAENFTIFLEGGLGVGKTFFVREMLQALGVTEDVSSPTYALVNEYKISKQRAVSGERFAHFDFYRLEDPNDFFARGFTDIADDSTVSCFVEWPEKISSEAKASFSGRHYTIRLEFGEREGARQVSLSKQ